MIISTVAELRLYIPNHAMDNLEGIKGSIYNSENDFLMEKLGRELYTELLKQYADMDEYKIQKFIDNIQTNAEITPWMQLLSIAQRVVAFDCMGRSVNIRAVSDNGQGINVAEADNYKAAEVKSLDNYRMDATKEAHSAVNIMLNLLEYWTKHSQTINSEDPELSESDKDELTIVNLWKSSRYYYLCSTLLLPSAEILNSNYLDIYDNREKFIRMIPDLKFIQEEKINPAFGEEFIDMMSSIGVIGTEKMKTIDATTNSETTLTTDQVQLLTRIVHKLRKVESVMLEERTEILKTSKERRMKAHDEAEMLLKNALDYLILNQNVITGINQDIKNAVALSPWYVNPDDTTVDTNECKFQNNKRGNALFVTPSLN